MQNVQAGDFIILGALTVPMLQDLRTKKVSLWVIGLFYIMVALAMILRGQHCDAYMLAGGLVGIGMILVSVITKQSVGLADGLIMAGIGVYFGVWRVVGMLILSMLLVAVVGLVAIIIKKADKHTKMPFIPFVFMAFIMMIWGTA